MDHLRDGINLRGYAQKDPLLEYKKEGFNYFGRMYQQITYDVVQKLFDVQVSATEMFDEHVFEGEEPDEPTGNGHAHENAMSQAEQAKLHEKIEAQMQAMRQKAQQLTLSHGGEPAKPATSSAEKHTDGSKVGRNDPCPCGSGKKYKKCHGA
jgi:preprotein translocase subunit SecA